MNKKHSGLWIIVAAGLFVCQAGCKGGTNGMQKAQTPTMPKRNHSDGYTESWDSKAVFLPNGGLELHGDTWVQGPFIITFP